MRTAVVVPAYDAAPTIGAVLAGLVARFPPPSVLLVVDDGSRDETAAYAERAGATVVRHGHNRGKGAALRTGLHEARARGCDVAITVDADGQHPPEEAWRMHHACADAEALVVGVRDLRAAGAPRPNQLSNAFSNLVMSAFVGARLSDTQCGLRRYPIATTLALGGREPGYGFEAELLIRAVAAGMHIVEVPIAVRYPPERVTHFDAWREPPRIVKCVLSTVAETRVRRLASSWGGRDR